LPSDKAIGPDRQTASANEKTRARLDALPHHHQQDAESYLLFIRILATPQAWKALHMSMQWSRELHLDVQLTGRFFCSAENVKQATRISMGNGLAVSKRRYQFGKATLGLPRD
jgi:hypothetical protein